MAWVDADRLTRFSTRTAKGWQPARPIGPKFFRPTRVARSSGRLIVAGLVGRPGTDADAALKVGPRFLRLGTAGHVNLAVGPRGIVVVRRFGARNAAVCLGLDGRVRGRYRFDGVKRGRRRPRGACPPRALECLRPGRPEPLSQAARSQLPTDGHAANWPARRRSPTTPGRLRLDDSALRGIDAGRLACRRPVIRARSERPRDPRLDDAIPRARAYAVVGSVRSGRRARRARRSGLGPTRSTRRRSSRARRR